MLRWSTFYRFIFFIGFGLPGPFAFETLALDFPDYFIHILVLIGYPRFRGSQLARAERKLLHRRGGGLASVGDLASVVL